MKKILLAGMIFLFLSAPKQTQGMIAPGGIGKKLTQLKSKLIDLKASLDGLQEKTVDLKHELSEGVYITWCTGIWYYNNLRTMPRPRL